jgi:hypothetical protein
MDDAAPDASTPWWGTFALDEEQGGRWTLGPSVLWVYRGRQDWRVVHRPSSAATTADPLAHHTDVTVPASEAEMDAALAADEDTHDTSRYSVRRTAGHIRVQPVLADRPVVSRPEHPLYVPEGESVTLYLSSALWVQVAQADEERVLWEGASHRMSDTWFGASTVQGELCYATRTVGRLRLDRLPRRLHRAVTPLRVQNRAQDALALERVQLPVPHLSLYRTADDRLWTNRVTMRHTKSGPGASVHVTEGPPDMIETAEQVQEPREADRKSLVTSTFSAFEALFGP